MPERNRLAAVLGTEASPIIIEDAQLKKRDQMARAQLRSLPLFIELGVSRFVYDDLWARAFDIVKHDHLVPDGDLPELGDDPLVHLATSEQLKSPDKQPLEQEHISQAEFTWRLFQRDAQSTGAAQYVFVSDTTTPHIESQVPVPGRSVADHFDATTFHYEQLLRDYVKTNVDSELPLHDTKNLYFHRVSEHHANYDAPADDLEALFDYTQAPPDSPVWQPLHYFLEQELESVLEEYEAHVTAALRSWIERGDTGKIAKRMIATLHRCDFDPETLDDYQHGARR